MKNFTSIENQKDHRENTGPVRRFLASSLVAAALFSSPMLETQAFAQDPPQTTQVARRDVHYDVSGGPQVRLQNGNSQINASLINEGSPVTVAFDGPATVSARFYPIVRSSDVATGTISTSVRYSLDGATPTEEPFSAGASTATHPSLASQGLAVGTPKDLQVTVSGEGTHRLSVSFPNGFLEVVSVLAPAQPDTPPVQPPPVQIQPVRTSTPTVHPDTPTAGRPYQSVRSTLSVDYSSFWLRNLGNGGNNGTLNQVDILYRHNLGEHLAFLVGPHLNLNETGISASGNRTHLMLGNVTAMAGLAGYFGKSTLYLAGFGGLQTASYNVNANDGRSSSDTQLGAAYGGRLGFDYSDILGISADLSNNPFNPGSVRLRIALPYNLSWVRDASASLDASLLWLHMFRPGTGDALGGGSLDENNLFLHAHALVPIWRLGPVVPSALVGFEYDRSLNGAGPVDRAAALLGGAITLDLFNRFRIEAGAGASVPDGAPFILLNANLR